MNLGINQLLQLCDEGAHIERVLWIERTGQRLVTIDVEDKQAWPSSGIEAFWQLARLNLDYAW